MTGDPTPVRTRLKEETRGVHRRTEDLPFFHALREGSLRLDAYRGYLVALRIILRSLTEGIQVAHDPRVSALRGEDGFRLTTLQGDLDSLEHSRFRESGESGWHPHPRAIVRAHLLAQKIRERARSSPASLLGTAYVLHGSVMGGPVLGKWAADAFGLQSASGATYLSGERDRARSGWERFLERLQAMELSEGETEEVVQAAVEAFEGFGSIVRSLHPEPEDLRTLPLQDLNPSAGDHPITVDPLELEAALRAGEDSWNRFPYYAERYGSRGAAFTRSDSAWLVTLGRAPEEAALANVLWLSRLLSTRGMPRWLMEEHLHRLHERLVDTAPAPRDTWRNLLLAAETLREMRTAHITDAEMAVIAEAFDASAGASFTGRFPETGALLAAAVADEADGIQGATRSVRDWFTSRRRFSASTIGAVKAAISASEAAAQARSR
ncbi:MAG: hypothetical protein EA351_13890 [Gemmatimonadales bacterium]|nr:MAG: hypothetical protein EA351_13890 [Gemmatimonadales bacterium]